MALRHLQTSPHWLHQSRFLRRPESRLWVLRTNHLHKTFLKQLRPSRFFSGPGCRKWVRMSFWHHETFLHRLHQSLLFLRLSEGRLWVERAIRLLKTSLKQLRLSRCFRWPGCRKWVRNVLKHFFIYFTKVVFKTSRGQFMRSLGHSPN
jgi:hypothetical protein